MPDRPDPQRRPDLRERGGDRRAGAGLLERVRELPGGHELLELAAGREDVELVGGAVRDLLLERTPRELDVVVGHDAAAFARELAGKLGTPAGQTDLGAQRERFGIREFERFGTFSVIWEVARIDIATRRSETYAAPGALPAVNEGNFEQDLQRRDFSVNAIALGLGGASKGVLRPARNALEDLKARRLRVLHRQSFIDDPTRLLRLGRYAARLGFTIEDGTAALAQEARAAGALATVSASRLGAELRLALGEADPRAALAEIDSLGLLAALHPGLRFEDSWARRALALLPTDGRADLLLLALVAWPLTPPEGEERGSELRGLLDRLQFPAPDRDLVLTAALAVPRLIEELPASASASALHALANGVPVEGIALAGALDAEGTKLWETARLWLEQLRGVQLQITGDDLLAAGIPRGPELGRRLHATLMLRLDGELGEGPEAELAAALAWTVQ